MDEVPRQAVRRGDDDHVELGSRHLVTQSIEARPLQARATVAVIPKDVLLPQHPVRMAADVRPEQMHLLLDRLRLLLPIR
jgi:hypothetical protein